MINILKEKRKAMGLTQTEVANNTGMLMHAYQKLESGRNKSVPLDRARRLAALLNTSIDELFPGDGRQ